MSCPDCFSGTVHAGTPTGTVVKLHGLDTYVAEPASGRTPTGIMVILPDAFGWDFVNLRLMADSFSRKTDYRIYLPDLMNGKSAPLWTIDTIGALHRDNTWWNMLSKPYNYFWLYYALGSFFWRNTFSVTFPRVKGLLESLRRNEAAHLPIGVAGYCWGGKHVLLLGENHKADGKPLMDAGFACHPSLTTFYSDIEKIKVPVSFAIPEKDDQFPLDKAERVREILEAFPDAHKGELKIYYGHSHGFGCRIDPLNADSKGPEDAENQAATWFAKHFAKAGY